MSWCNEDFLKVDDGYHLPGDIEQYLFDTYVKAHFRVSVLCVVPVAGLNAMYELGILSLFK